MDVKYYEYKLGDLIEIPDKLDSRGKSVYTDDFSEIVGKRGNIIGIDFVLSEDMDLHSYLLNATEAFKSTVKGRKTIYIVRLENDELIRVYYDSMKLVKSIYDIRTETLNRLVDLKLELEEQLSKKTTQYRRKKIKKIHDELKYIMAEFADKETIECYNINIRELVRK